MYSMICQITHGMKDDESKIGNLVQVCRERAGLTQEQLASRASITRQHLSAIETGRELSTVETISILLKACGYKFEDCITTPAEEEKLA